MHNLHTQNPIDVNKLSNKKCKRQVINLITRRCQTTQAASQFSSRREKLFVNKMVELASIGSFSSGQRRAKNNIKDKHSFNVMQLVDTWPLLTSFNSCLAQVRRTVVKCFWENKNWQATLTLWKIYPVLRYCWTALRHPSQMSAAFTSIGLKPKQASKSLKYEACLLYTSPSPRDA